MSKISSEYTERRADWISIAVVCGHLGIVFLPIWMASYFGSWIALLIGYLWFVVTQNGLTNLMHEAAHRMVFRNPKWSDFLGHWVLGPFFMTNFELYRRRHWVHHNHAGTENDTKSTYLVRFASVAEFLVFVLRCLTGVEALRRFRGTLAENQFVKPLTRQQIREGFVGFVTFHALFGGLVLALALAGTGGNILHAGINALLAYGVVYLYGMATGTILLSTLRGIAEHQVLEGTQETVGAAALRNLSPTIATRVLFGSYGFCEHGTHHAYPSIPYYNLPVATRALPAAEYGPSYWGILATAIRSDPLRN